MQLLTVSYRRQYLPFGLGLTRSIRGSWQSDGVWNDKAANRRHWLSYSSSLRLKYSTTRSAGTRTTGARSPNGL